MPVWTCTGKKHASVDIPRVKNDAGVDIPRVKKDAGGDLPRGMNTQGLLNPASERTSSALPAPPETEMNIGVG